MARPVSHGMNSMMGTEERTPGVVEVRVHEPRLNAGVADILRRQLNALVRLDTTRVILDFVGVESVDVAGLASIVWLRKRLGDGPQIVVRDATPSVQDMLHRAHVDRLVIIESV